MEAFWPALENQAKKIGFSEIGVCSVQDIPEEGMLLNQWIDKGYSADMKYMKDTQQIRKDPQKFLPGVKSVIVGVVPYFRAYKSKKEVGKIARYAAGPDYHRVIKKMLLQLAEFVHAEFFPDAEKNDFRISLDAHPVLERMWAQKSGLGFVGKNTCLITKKAGSWVLIGCVFTTQLIPCKPKNKNAKVVNEKELDFSKLSCGSCTRCIDACPTGAIVAPKQIDARKCISYLTIENKGSIPKKLRKKIGNRIFGCDICQEVCPYNIPRQKGVQSPLLEREIAGTEVLIPEILQIKTQEEFVKRFAGSPLMRAKRNGMIRNACVVAGNSGNKKFLPLLKEVFQREKDSILKEHAEWAIEQILN